MLYMKKMVPLLLVLHCPSPVCISCFTMLILSNSLRVLQVVMGWPKRQPQLNGGSCCRVSDGRICNSGDTTSGSFVLATSEMYSTIRVNKLMVTDPVIQENVGIYCLASHCSIHSLALDHMITSDQIVAYCLVLVELTGFCVVTHFGCHHSTTASPIHTWKVSVCSKFSGYPNIENYRQIYHRIGLLGACA